MNANAAALHVLRAVIGYDVDEYRRGRRELARSPYREQRLALWRHAREALTRRIDREDALGDALYDVDPSGAPREVEREHIGSMRFNFVMEADEEYALAVMLESRARRAQHGSLNALATIAHTVHLNDATDDGIVLVNDVTFVSTIIDDAGRLFEGGSLALLVDFDVSQVSDADAEEVLDHFVESIEELDLGAIPTRDVTAREFALWVDSVAPRAEVTQTTRETYESALQASVEGEGPSVIPEFASGDAATLRFAVVCHAFVAALRGDWPPTLISPVDDMPAVAAECYVETVGALRSGALPVDLEALVGCAAAESALELMSTRAREQIEAFGDAAELPLG